MGRVAYLTDVNLEDASKDILVAICRSTEAASGDVADDKPVMVFVPSSVASVS